MTCLTYNAWRLAVDRKVDMLTGLSSDDLTDADYRGMFDDELEPLEAAEQVIENAGVPAELIF